MRGAIREDDLKASSYANPNDRPDVDPWMEIDRPIFHFYNPVTNESGLPLVGGPSLKWALGEVDPFAASTSEDTMRGNHFSYVDAIKSYYTALTYKQGAPINALKAKADSDARLSLYASALNSLGHVIHLLQETASPQHSRSERHNYVCKGVYKFGNEDPATRTYENFSNFRVVSEYNRTLSQSSSTSVYTATNACEENDWLDLFNQGLPEGPPGGEAFRVSTYPIPSFSLPREYFTTRESGDPTDPDLIPLATLNQRRGLADYANRGFYTQGGLDQNLNSPPSIDSPDVVFSPSSTDPIAIPGLGSLRLKVGYWKVPDAVAPSYVDSGLDSSGRAPIVSKGYWSTLGVQRSRNLVSLANYTQMGNMLGPRAIAYSAGLINHFFRGKLEVEPIAQRVFAVMNQGVSHTVDSDGYPRRSDNNGIFGFEAVRLNVRNSTDPIVESGTVSIVDQIAGGGTLRAVARYHRNACYKPDLSGERVESYSPPPALIIAEPACVPGQSQRTEFQEISVSAPIPVSGPSDLPGGAGQPLPAFVEKMFDFSADPIPINATDLFIQVVYLGRLGEEREAVAVGTFDVREPTIVAAWNNTDYFYNNSIWLPQNSLYPLRAADNFRSCSGLPAKWMYSVVGGALDPALKFPVTGNNPGVARYAYLFAPPIGAGNLTIRSVPVMIPEPHADVRVSTTKGRQQQANKERIDSSVLAAPQYCRLAAPTANTYWCWDPIQKRRGLRFGDVAQPIYYSVLLGNNGPDVDSVPLPAFTSMDLQDVGENKFNIPGPLQDCPAQPISTTASEAEKKRFDLQQELIEIEEWAGWIGLPDEP
ncbi:hypothetical protein C7S18_17775 [Ahniella affigens]|uniref:Uncharacterized protein n=2 Tax=Ahniella affigens TaxID=2021234 RepID=A0A2P1PVV4_9GAMM|nr:hypothetical protein C7S18_17775 [Ahniella affigens]